MLLAACERTPPPPPKPAGTLEMTERAAQRTRIAQVETVRVSEVDQAEQVEFEVRPLPGYHIEYINEVRSCSSDELIAVPGKAWLEVSLRPAEAHTESGEPRIPFSEQLVNLPLVEAIRSTCDYEAEVTWVIGLNAKVPYRVTEGTEPVRLIVSFDH